METKSDFAFLAEKDSMWAQMLVNVLKDNGIPCTAMPVHGAGLVMKTGMKERLKIFVPAEKKPQAEEILEELFSAC